MNSLAKELFQLAAEAMQMQRDAALGRPLNPTNHQRHIAEFQETQQEGRCVAVQPVNPHE